MNRHYTPGENTSPGVLCVGGGEWGRQSPLLPERALLERAFFRTRYALLLRQGHPPVVAEATAAPSEQGKGWCIVLAHTAPHPSLLRKATFPQGKAIFRTFGAVFLFLSATRRRG